MNKLAQEVKELRVQIKAANNAANKSEGYRKSTLINEAKKLNVIHRQKYRALVELAGSASIATKLINA